LSAVVLHPSVVIEVMDARLALARPCRALRRCIGALMLEYMWMDG